MKESKPLIIITGASSGLGAGIAKHFSDAGDSLGLLPRNLKAQEALHLPYSICIETDVMSEFPFNPLTERL